MNLEKDTTVSHYRILRKIGKGGMGEVFLAEDTKLDRQAAIKFLSEEFSQDTDKLNRFIQEAKAASALNHPNILTVYEIGEYKKNHYIVTEFIDGKPLNEVLSEEPLELEKAINFAIHITSALASAHDAGIIHRDIKAHNVMIRKDGIAKLLDFGLAKLTFQSINNAPDQEAETLARVMTLPGMLMGTPTYMSPEQVRGKQLDARTDIFSFGILFFEMLTGKRPFNGDSYADIMGAILKDEPPPLSGFLENVPSELYHIVDKTLRKDREQRYQNVKDLVIDLKDLRDAIKFEAKLVHSTGSTKSNIVHSTDATPAAPTVQIMDETVNFRRSSVLPLIMIFSLILAAAAGGVWWMMSYRGNQTAVSAPVEFEKKDITSWNSAPGELFSTGTFSPDGKMIAYSSVQSGSKNIWIKQTSSGEAIQVTKDSFNNQNPIWSPTGSEIAFFSERGNSAGSKGNTTGVWRIPTLGGTPVSIAPVEDGGSQLRFWGKSGKLYYESLPNLFAADIESGKTEQITSLPKEAQVKIINISADEKQIAFVQKDGANWKIMVSAVNGDNPQQVVSTENEISSLVWHSDNERILFSQNIDGTFQIFAVNKVGGEATRLTNGEGDSLVIDVSADGSNILTASAREESNLWNVNTETLEENIVSSSINSELWADVSNDNQKIAFQSVKNLSQGNNLLSGEILVKTSGSNAQPLKVSESAFLPKWSPDGQRLAFMRFIDDEPQIWAVNAAVGKEEKLTSGKIPAIGYSVLPYNTIQTSNFAWSPDGKTIVYLSSRNGFSNIWQVASDGSADVQITNNNDKNLLLNCPIWSDDGSHIAFYSKSNQLNAEGKQIQSLWITGVDSKETRPIFETSSIMRLIGWNESGKGLIFASPSKFTGLPPEVVLSEVETATGKQTLLATLKSVYYYNIFLSRDRKTIAYVANQDSKDNIWVINSDGGNARKLTNNNDPNLYISSLSWSPDGSAIFYGKQTRFSLLSMLINFK